MWYDVGCAVCGVVQCVVRCGVMCCVCVCSALVCAQVWVCMHAHVCVCADQLSGLWLMFALNDQNEGRDHSESDECEEPPTSFHISNPQKLFPHDRIRILQLKIIILFKHSFKQHNAG